MPLTLNGTTGIAGVDGSAGTPATKGSDTDTGIVYGTNTVQIATNGTTAVTVDASQNVGVGTATPAGKLDVVATSATSSLFVRSSGIANGAQVAQDTGGTAYFTNGYASGWTYVGGAGPNCIFTTGSTERARFDVSGNLLVGTTSAGGRLSVVGSAVSIDTRTTGTADVIFVVGNTSGTTATNVYIMPIRIGSTAAFKGGIFYNGATGLLEYQGSSDYRTKKDIIDAPPTLELVSGIKVREFLVKGASERVTGFIAHELAESVSYAVTGEKDAVDENGEPILQTVNQQALIPLLVKSIQELSAKLDAAEARLAALEAK